jgi:hypothetical protein
MNLDMNLLRKVCYGVEDITQSMSMQTNEGFANPRNRM